MLGTRVLKSLARNEIYSKSIFCCQSHLQYTVKGNRREDQDKRIGALNSH